MSDVTNKTVETTPSNTPGVESRIYGKWGMIIRYLCGLASVSTMCLIAYMDAVTTRISVLAGHGWPGEWHFLIMTIGVTICAISFNNANKTLSVILGAGGIGDKARNLVLSKITGGLQNNQPAPPNVYHWWNGDTKTFVTVGDGNDLSNAGFTRVPLKRPDDSSIWDPNTETWMRPVPAVK